MKPIAVRSSAVVQAPAGFVWDFLHVYANDLEWRSGLEKMAQTPPGPVRDGARVEETLRVLGRVVESVVEVADVREGHSFAWRVAEGATADGSRAVTATGETSCRVDIVKRVTLTGSDRLLRPVIAAVITRTERGDLRRVKHLLERSWQSR
ncbi:SRPBCC family protein [Streptomyces sp. OUCMDZ-4982]|uniref:SRPBCC family protein n=1 Tax=Streptomyces sp. OUCMDZ-4982 TaxID=2973090 RepID=UPI00215BDBA4|nr:SRPBCC family protein [Streptomyces sp. OUCMDZ-4982]MCR8942878.1 SRPBCC family protein [Streptomyces sp. OUCMDZ-4982]